MAIKKSFEALTTLANLHPQMKVENFFELDETTAITHAKTGGGSSNPEDNWIFNEAKEKIGRKCAILGAWYPFNNTDRELSHFYKNGSYHIVVEKLKAVKTKEHKDAQLAELLSLETQMLAGEITPLEWKEAKDQVITPFIFEISDELKRELVTLTKGKEDKTDDVTNPYSAVRDDVEAYIDSLTPEPDTQPEPADTQPEPAE